VIICEIIVYLLVSVQSKKAYTNVWGISDVNEIKKDKDARGVVWRRHLEEQK
jgi:hypothetical protein